MKLFHRRRGVVEQRKACLVPGQILGIDAVERRRSCCVDLGCDTGTALLQGTPREDYVCALTSEQDARTCERRCQ